MARALGALKPMLLVGLVLLLVFALLVTLAVVAQRRLIYLPDRADPPSAADYFPAAQDVTLDTADGLSLTAWHVPAGSPQRDLTVLVAPGNAGNRQGRVPLAQELREAGFSVLLLDYRGYGGNPGRPTEAGLAADARAAHDYLVQQADIPPERIIYFGESLGAGVVTGLATERPPGGMVLRSPFVDLAEAGAVHYPFLPVRTLLWDRYPVADRVAQLPVPTAVIYGEQDSIVPPEQSREVAARAAGPVQITEVPGADHNDLVLLRGEPVIQAVVALADQIPPG